MEAFSDRRITPASGAGSILRGSLVHNMREERDWQERPYRQTSTRAESFLGLRSSKRRARSRRKDPRIQTGMGMDNRSPP
jgi:hypothetical protein